MIWFDLCNCCCHDLDGVMEEYLDGDTMAGVTVGDTRLGSCCQLTLCSTVLLMAGENAHTIAHAGRVLRSYLS